MKNLIVTCGMICLFLGSIPLAQAVMYIESPENQSFSLNVKRVYTDDSGDDDQSFIEPHQFHIQIDNIARRYVGVYIDRIIRGHGTEKIDNGRNDEIILPGAELTSLEMLRSAVTHVVSWVYPSYEELAYEYQASSRRYALPVPAVRSSGEKPGANFKLSPGDEVRFRVKVLGPAVKVPYVENRLPFDPFAEDAPPEAAQLKKAMEYTLWAIMAEPLVHQFIPDLKAKNIERWEELYPALKRDFGDFMLRNPKLVTFWEQGNYKEVVKQCVKWIGLSETIKTLAVGEGRYNKLIDNVFGARELWAPEPVTPDEPGSPAVTAAESLYLLLSLVQSNWIDEFNIYVVVPRIDEISPKDGRPGDRIAIYGAGFDCYSGESERTQWIDKQVDEKANRVYFTTLNDYGVPMTTLAAEVVSVPSEDEIHVIVPEGFAPGDVMVCVDGLCSNKVMFADDFKATLQINEPSNGAKLVDTTSLVAEIYDPPEGFPEYPATKRLFIDGKKWFDNQVQSTEFSFTLDVDAIGLGKHTARVEVAFPGRVISDSIDFEVIEEQRPQYYVINKETYGQWHWTNYHCTWNRYEYLTVNPGDTLEQKLAEVQAKMDEGNERCKTSGRCNYGAGFPRYWIPETWFIEVIDGPAGHWKLLDKPEGSRQCTGEMTW